MAIPTSKTELLADIAVSFEKLAADLAKVPPHRATAPTMDGHAAGTMMSPADLVAYLIGWNELVLKWLTYDDAGTPCELPETGYKWNQLGQLAQKFYADYADLDWPTRLARLHSAQAQIARTVASRTNTELYGKPWYGKWTKGRMIQLNTASPYANARGRIRKWLRQTT